MEEPVLQVRLENLRGMTLVKKQGKCFEIQDSLPNYRVIADDHIQTKSTCILSIVYILGINYNIKTDVNLFHLQTTLMCNCKHTMWIEQRGEIFWCLR